jgi:3-deoxy-manno-octulosonate cytidylyltransferase (CMP-KDO synthetase)
MIVHVVRRATLARLVSRVIVATDDERVSDAVVAHGGTAVMTSPVARSGTDRVAEAARSLDFEIVVNVQGDEPLIDPQTIDAAIEPLINDPRIHISTTSEPVASVEDVLNPNVVKVTTDADGCALYFSRSAIPYIRGPQGVTLENLLMGDLSLLANYRKHSGLYCYRNKVLRDLSAMETSPLEVLESLEQLRALTAGYRIRVVSVEHRSVGVDTRQDYERVKSLMEEHRV